jgi:hypothetical protein
MPEQDRIQENDRIIVTGLQRIRAGKKLLDPTEAGR